MNRMHGVFLAAALAALPSTALACACGCDVFEVGGASMVPNESGGMASLEYDFLDQNQNWNGTSQAPATDNSDKEIRTNFFTVGMNYMFNRQWGLDVQIPLWDRAFRTDLGDGTPTNPDIASFRHQALGDIRVLGRYAGFSPAMNTGVLFGLKLPTGDWSYPNFDRDTEIGTGSTNLLLGAYHVGVLDMGRFNWWTQVNTDLLLIPDSSPNEYVPGDEGDLGFGMAMNLPMGARGRISPVLNLIGSWRGPDSGAAGHPDASGYQRGIVAPGLEVRTGNTRLYGDIEVPVYQNMNGDQLVSPFAFKFIVSRMF